MNDCNYLDHIFLFLLYELAYVFPSLHWLEIKKLTQCDISFTVTLLSIWCMVVLFYAEVKDFMTPGITEDLFVDTSRGPKLRINLDIVMPTISCSCEYFKFLRSCLVPN